MLDYFGVSEANWRTQRQRNRTSSSPKPHYVGRATAHLAGDPEVSRWNGQSLSSGQLAQVYSFTDLDGSVMRRYIREVQEVGKPADATGYR